MAIAPRASGSTLTERRRKRAARVRIYKGRACPVCDTALQGPLATGDQVCPACASSFRAAVFEPPTDPGPAVLPSGAGTPCARHARNLAESSCQRCGAFMCSLCRIETDGKEHCAECFNRLAGEGALPSAVQRIHNHNAVAGLVAVVGCLFWPAAILLGPIAMVYAVRGRRQNRRTGESISVAMGWIGLVLGAIEFGGCAIFYIALLLRMGR